ncbi:hydantoinase/oxoprolinase family protein [Rhodobium gokarnense]|uniref:N-methylhydantoinase A n=1 Tax=Rhodobium gokarnense TaxID=364296 RepID=A0ABT3HB98_9HYPH|nr:hydantoinase/oxoprolinase family protein [Rhodobium gokarnense]MCW2307677.1 N-methylhydantoinase A [Rhodobium gokarnense]
MAIVLDKKGLSARLLFCVTQKEQFMIRIGIDIGGTFTDFVAWREGEDEVGLSFKLPSSPPDFDRTVCAGFDRIVDEMKPDHGETVMVMHGTTVSTNMVIERAGARLGLLTTDGFRDLMGLQRLRLKDPTGLFNDRPTPLVPRQHVFPVAGRIDAHGREIVALDEAAIADAARQAAKAGVESLAIAFINSFRNPEHERRARDIARKAAPGMDVSLSSDIWPQIGEYERALIALLNGFVKKRMSDYLTAIETHMASRHDRAHLFVTRSNGGAMSTAEARREPVHTLLSGPASGVAAASFLGRLAKIEDLLTFDMGGTSTDMSLIRDGQPTVSREAEVGDFPLSMPVTGIEAIGAGGGSVIAVRDGVLSVGPQSTQSYPGPACYGRGGTRPALTDAYLLCNYIDERHFLGGQMPLDRDAALKAMAPVADALGLSIEAAAEAAIRVATANMVAAVMPYLARLGMNPELVSMVLFGGAGGVHGPLLAAEIGVPRIVVPQTSSVFCAFGGLISTLTHDVVENVHRRPLGDGLLAASFDGLERQARSWLSEQIDAGMILETDIEHVAAMRYAGQSFDIDVVLDAAARAGDVAAAFRLFHAEHERLYAHCDPEADVEFMTLRVRIRGSLAGPKGTGRRSISTGNRNGLAPRDLRIGGALHAGASAFHRDGMAAEDAIAGPAVIEQDDATTLVPPGFVARLGLQRELIIERQA